MNSIKTRTSRRTAERENFLRGGLVPVGGIVLIAGNADHEGMVPCDGAAVSRTDYPQLFAAVGTTFGAGDGSTTFNVPTLQAPGPGLRYWVRYASTVAELGEAEAF